MELKDMLKILRTSRGLTQKEVSEQLNIKQYNLSDYETGRATPSIELLLKLSDLYQISMDDLLNHETKYDPFDPKSKSSSTSIFDPSLQDLHSLKILRRIQNLTPKEKDQLYSTIDSIIKNMFNK